MLKGHNVHSIKKILNISNPTVYRDIQFLTKKSKEYIYDLTKGTHVLSYQRSIEGISLTLKEAWSKFNDPKVQEKQKVSYLRLTKECNETMFELTANGPTEMAVLDIMRRANRLGIDTINDNGNDNNNPLMLTEQEQIRNYINTNPRLSGDGYGYGYDNNNTNTNKPE